MQTREVPRDEWVAFFDAFSRRHDGWLVTIETFRGDLGAQIQAQDRQLSGVSADLSAPEPVIAIMLSHRTEHYLTHFIPDPSRVSLEQTDDGADVALQIVSSGDLTTLLRFRSVQLPEAVDGVA